MKGRGAALMDGHVHPEQHEVSFGVRPCLSGRLPVFNAKHAEVLTRDPVGSAGTHSCRVALRGWPENWQVRTQFSGCLTPGKELSRSNDYTESHSNANFAWTCFHRLSNMNYSVRNDTLQSHSYFQWCPCHAAIVLVATAGSLHLQRFRTVSPQTICRPRAQHTASPHVWTPVPCGA